MDQTEGRGILVSEFGREVVVTDWSRLLILTNCCSSVQIRSTSRSPSSCIVVVRLRDVAVVGGLSYTTPLPLLGEKSRWFVREVKLASFSFAWTSMSTRSCTSWSRFFRMASSTRLSRSSGSMVDAGAGVEEGLAVGW